MTMIVFDGKEFWTDGASTFPNSQLTDMNLYNHHKLVVLDTPLKTNRGGFVKALAGTGASEDCYLIIREFNRAGNIGETFEHCRRRLEAMLKNRMDCWVVGVNVTLVDGTQKVSTLSAFKSVRWIECGFNYEDYHDNYVMAGDSIKLPMGFQCKWMKTGAEVIALASILNPKGVGGQISRYNPITDKLDHPKPLNEVRQRQLLKKFKAHQMAELEKSFATYDETLDKRFPKDLLGRGVL